MKKTKLSPVENIIFKKYGQEGLKVYGLIDGVTPARQIMNKTGLAEPKIVEILCFMDTEGIIRLDYQK